MTSLYIQADFAAAGLEYSPLCVPSRPAACKVRPKINRGCPRYFRGGSSLPSTAEPEIFRMSRSFPKFPERANYGDEAACARRGSQRCSQRGGPQTPVRLMALFRLAWSGRAEIAKVAPCESPFDRKGARTEKNLGCPRLLLASSSFAACLFAKFTDDCSVSP